MTLKPWTPNIDPATIPDEILKAERARRNARKRTTYTGGLYWRKHNPKAAGCRCRECMAAREAVSQ